MGLLDIFSHNYPYTDFHELNLDWVIKRVIELDENLKNFINLNTIKYANPILWDITRQYEANTVVIDGATGNAYISIKAVPSGVQINRTEYWTQIYNYQNIIETLREQIARANEGENTTASYDRKTGELIWLNGKLVRMTRDILAGDRYVEDVGTPDVIGNYVYTSVENEFKIIYQPSSEILTINSIIDGTADITAVGDVHTYSATDQTISIIHND